MKQTLAYIVHKVNIHDCELEREREKEREGGRKWLEICGIYGSIIICSSTGTKGKTSRQFITLHDNTRYHFPIMFQSIWASGSGQTLSTFLFFRASAGMVHVRTKSQTL